MNSGKKYEYSFRIDYKIVAGSKRERGLLELAKMYGVDVGTHLLDRIVEDRGLISIARSSEKAEALRKREEADKVIMRLNAGGV